MSDALLLAGVTASAYAATNLDQLVLLIAFRAAGGGVRVSLAHALVLAMVLGASLAAETAADSLDPALLGHLGWIPIALGVSGLLRLRRRVASAGGSGVSVDRLTVPAMAFAMLAHSGDLLAALVPLAAETRETLLPVLWATTALAGLVWLGLARAIAGIPGVQERLEGLAPYLLPPLLIAVGVYILLDSRSDVPI